MTKTPKDIHGNDIEVGDLVVSSTVTSYSNMVVGVVSRIGEPPHKWADQTISITYLYERNKYAYEIGAPDLEEKYQDWGQYYDETEKRNRYGYHGPEKTRMVKDRRKVGRTTDTSTQRRQKTCNILVIRKKDGTVPDALTNIIENHKILYPNPENASE